ncbi:MAG: hypothetical protein KAR81_01425 [Sulfurimonas sp.]|nr:hypothetical protein [Sulfurimonas sp.]
MYRSLISSILLAFTMLPLAKDKLVHGITEVLSYGKNNEHEEIFITDYEQGQYNSFITLY